MFSRFSKHSIKTVIVCLYVCSLFWNVSGLLAADSFQIETPPMPGQSYSPSRTVSPEDTATPPGPGEGLKAQDRLPPEVRRIDDQIRESTRILTQSLDERLSIEDQTREKQLREENDFQPDTQRQKAKQPPIQKNQKKQAAPKSNRQTTNPDMEKDLNAGEIEEKRNLMQSSQYEQTAKALDTEENQYNHDPKQTHTSQAALQTQPVEPNSFILTLMFRSSILLVLIGFGFFIIRRYFFS